MGLRSINTSCPAPADSIIIRGLGKNASQHLHRPSPAHDSLHGKIPNIVSMRRRSTVMPDLKGIFLSWLFLLLIPMQVSAGQVTLVWQSGTPAPQGYRIYQRTDGQTYDYAHPVWPTDGTDHPETTCQITNLQDGVTYHFVARAYAGSLQSSNSNEVSFRVGQDPSPDSDGGSRPPTAEAGANKTVFPGQRVLLNGSGSSDPDGDLLTYRWVQRSGPAAALSGMNNYQCSFTAPEPADLAATLVFELTVTDGNGYSSADTCLVLVKKTQSSPPGTDTDDVADNSGTLLANHPPFKPEIISPANGEIAAALHPWLKASKFSDQDSGDQHNRTQWRVTLSGDSQYTVMDRMGDAAHLTQIQVPHLILDPSTTYAVQVRYYDNHGASSPWSLPVTFTTPVDPEDSNGDKVPDTQQVSAESDVNRDSIPDLQQPAQVKSIATDNGQRMMAVSIETDETGTQVQSAAGIDPDTLESSDYSGHDPEGDLPFGLLGCKISVDQPGTGVWASIHLSHAMDPRRTQWVCFDEITGMADCSASTTIDQGGLVIQRYLEDGGAQDADGTANGIIVDLSGPRTSSSANDSSLALTTDGPPSSGRNDLGCFIASLF